MSIPISPFPLSEFIPVSSSTQVERKKKMCDIVSTNHPPPPSEEESKEKIIIFTESMSTCSYETIQDAINAKVLLIKKLKKMINDKKNDSKY